MAAIGRGLFPGGHLTTAEDDFGLGVTFRSDHLWSTSEVETCSHLDLVVQCKDGNLAASSVLLSAASPLLRQLLEQRHGVEESGVQLLLLPEVPKDLVGQLLQLLSAGSTNSLPAQVVGLLGLAAMLGLPINPSSVSLAHKEVEDEESEDVGLLEVQGLLDRLRRAASVEMKEMKQQPLVVVSVKSDYNVVKSEDEEEEDEDGDSDQGDGEDGDGDDVDWNTPSWSPPREEVKEDDEWTPSFSEGTAGRKSKMNQEELEESLSELGGSTLHLDGKNVVCGICKKLVQVPGDRRMRGKYSYFRRTHFKSCSFKLEPGERKALNLPPMGVKDESGAPDDQSDCLEEVWARHYRERNIAPDIPGMGRKKADLPSIETIRQFLTALGGAVLVENGTKVKCGVCRNNFRVTAGRPIMGNLRYFEKTHLVGEMTIGCGDYHPC